MSARASTARRARGLLRTMAATVAVLATVPALAVGPPPSVQLVYERVRGAEQCPAVEVMRRGVASRLGRDPFRADGVQVISVRITPAGAGLAATIEVRDNPGASLGTRTLTSPGRDCVELAAAVELAVTIAIDPLSLGRRPPDRWEDIVVPPVPAAPPPRAADAPAGGDAGLAQVVERVTSAPARQPAPRQPIVPFASFGVLAAVGSAPAVTAGGALAVGLRRGRLSLALEARADLPGSTDASGGTVSGTLALAAIVPCYHLGWFAGCALVGGGILHGSGGGFPGARQDTTAYGAAGARLAAELPLKGIVALRLNADLLAPLRRTTLAVGGTGVWSSPPVSGAFGIAVAVRFR